MASLLPPRLRDLLHIGAFHCSPTNKKRDNDKVTLHYTLDLQKKRAPLQKKLNDRLHTERKFLHHDAPRTKRQAKRCTFDLWWRITCGPAVMIIILSTRGVFVALHSSPVQFFFNHLLLLGTLVFRLLSFRCMTHRTGPLIIVPPQVCNLIIMSPTMQAINLPASH